MLCNLSYNSYNSNLLSIFLYPYYLSTFLSITFVFSSDDTYWVWLRLYSNLSVDSYEQNFSRKFYAQIFSFFFVFYLLTSFLVIFGAVFWEVFSCNVLSFFLEIFITRVNRTEDVEPSKEVSGLPFWKNFDFPHNDWAR
jgi:hypothetical protein